MLKQLLLMMILGLTLTLQAQDNTRSAKLHKYYTELSVDNMQLLKDFYTEDVLFIDPVGELKGVNAVYEYTKKMYEAATSVKFEINEETISGDTHVIRWKMLFVSKSLKNGEPIIVPGISWIRFRTGTNLAEFHQDVFDMGAMVYEHVPVVGFFIRNIKGKFKHDTEK